ncbi:MAG: sensor histidine kinase, partial [Spirochaetes bacterium]|nr:sensor histidine kinase [Spirochaetota bacterium]
IDKQIIDKIFNRFFSYRPDIQNKEKHTGLGLSIVKSIVEAYSGSICAKNNANRGAEFAIEFPNVV